MDNLNKVKHYFCDLLDVSFLVPSLTNVKNVATNNPRHVVIFVFLFHCVLILFCVLLIKIINKYFLA